MATSGEREQKALDEYLSHCPNIAEDARYWFFRTHQQAQAVKVLIRKLSVLAMLFSGVFLLINYVGADLFHVGSWIYCSLQIAGLVGLVLLLAKKKIEVY